MILTTAPDGVMGAAEALLGYPIMPLIVSTPDGALHLPWMHMLEPLPFYPDHLRDLPQPWVQGGLVTDGYRGV